MHPHKNKQIYIHLHNHTVKCLMLDYAQFAKRMKDEIIVAKLGRFVVQRHFQLKGK